MMDCSFGLRSGFSRDYYRIIRYDVMHVNRALGGEKTHLKQAAAHSARLWPDTHRKNLFFFDEFSMTNSLDRPFFPSSTIQAFSLVSASAVSPVVTQMSYSVRGKARADKSFCLHSIIFIPNVGRATRHNGHISDTGYAGSEFNYTYGQYRLFNVPLGMLNWSQYCNTLI